MSNFSYSKLSIRNKILIIFIPLFAAVFGLGLFAYYNSMINNVDFTTKSNLLRQMQTFENIQGMLMDNALKTSQLFSTFTYIEDIYKNPNQELAYLQIKDSISKVIKKITDDPKSFQIHFHRPPAISFLRSWTKKHGDNLESFRKTILKVYETKLPLKAVELGVGGFALRGIAPIFSKSKEYLGSVEYFYTPDDALKLLKTKDNKIGFYSTVSASLADKLFEPKELAKSFPNKESGHYFSKPSEDWMDIKNAAVPSVIKALNSGKQTIVIEGTSTFGIHPVLDFENNIVGNIIFVKNNTKQYKEAQNSFIKIAIIIGFVGLLLYFTFSFAVNKIVSNPLSDAVRLAKNIQRGIFKE